MPLFSTNRGYVDEERVRIIVTRLFESLGSEKSIWEYYNEMAAVEDNIREVEWRDLADTVLVFDGLFAAFLSAFLVYLIPQLQSSSTDVAMDVLIHISKQLSNSTTPAFEPTAFQVPSNTAAVNMLFFLSLALVLIDAFLAMLVKGWLQEFDRGWRKYTIAHLRAQERERRLRELERWKLHELVALLPMLIQGSLLLFCIGLLLLISPLHLPSGILCSLALVSVVGFYGFTTYVSIVNIYAPFSSPVSRLLPRGFAMLQSWYNFITHNAQRIASAMPFHNRTPLSPQGQQADADASDETTQSLPSNGGLARSGQPHNADSAQKGNIVSRSHSGIDPQVHVHVLERLVATTDEVVENIPIFLELLDQPVKDPTMRPSNVENWRELLQISLRLLRDQSTFSVSAACTLARTMMICYDHKTRDEQIYLTLVHYLGSNDADDQRSHSRDLWRRIAFLEPSDAADAELLWMVNTFHRTMYFVSGFESNMDNEFEDRFDTYLGFFAAVLTYVSSTEQSKRSKVPLTAAVIYSMHTIRSSLDQGGIRFIGGLYMLPGNASISESVLMTFCHVDGIDALDLWSEECIQFVKDLLQWDWPPHFLNDFRLSLIAALYIDSTKQAHVHSTFADLLKHTSIAEIAFQFSDAYDDGKLAIYSYIALTQWPLPWNSDPLAGLFIVIGDVIASFSPLQLLGLQILEIALKHVHKLAASTSNWLKIEQDILTITLPGHHSYTDMIWLDNWIMLHLDTLLPPQPYLPPGNMKMLEWSNTPEEVHIANARLDLYDSLAKAGHEGAKAAKPDPKLLRFFLWSKDYDVCTRAFSWCLDLVPISSSYIPGDANSTSIFIPETMGYEWIEHFIHVLCKDPSFDKSPSQTLLLSGLRPKWTMLPSSWCHDFTFALLLTVVSPPCEFELPAYQYLFGLGQILPLGDKVCELLPFLATLLEPIKSSLTWASLCSIENWWALLPRYSEIHVGRAQIRDVLATAKRQLQEENLVFFAELPMASEWLEENLESFAELPMASEWMNE